MVKDIKLHKDHFIPEVFAKNWYSNENSLYTTYITGSTKWSPIYQKTTAEVFYLKGRSNLLTGKTYTPEIVENKLQINENNWNNIYRKIKSIPYNIHPSAIFKLNNKALSDKLVKFIFELAVRTPYKENIIKSNFKPYFKNYHFKTDQFFEHQVYNQYLNIGSSFEWLKHTEVEIFYNNSSTPFILSDDPVITPIFNDLHEKKFLDKINIIYNRNYLAITPISPNLGIGLSNGKIFKKIIPGKVNYSIEDLAKDLNYTLFIKSFSNNQPYSRIASNNKSILEDLLAIKFEITNSTN